MRALLLTDRRQFELTDFPTPEVGPDDVLVRVAACGICGSDVHGYDGSSGRRIPPIIMGHEASGTVAAVGGNVREFGEGDRVTFDSMISCGRCSYCRRGEPNLCDHRRVLGVSCDEYRRHGAFAEYVVVPRHITYKLPDGVSFEQAAMIEPVSVAVHAVDLSPVKLGDTAVVVGAGMIGQLVIQCLKLAGCATVIATDLDDTRLTMAARSGADHTLVATEDVPGHVLELTGGRGADVAMEAVGATAPLRTAICSVRKGGTVTLIGNVTANVELAMQRVVTRQISLIGSCASAGEYPACIGLLAAGKIDVSELISAKADLAEGPGWFDKLYSHTPGLMKVLLTP